MPPAGTYPAIVPSFTDSIVDAVSVLGDTVALDGGEERHFEDILAARVATGSSSVPRTILPVQRR